MEVERTTNKNISLYPSHINQVKRFQVFKNFKGESEAYQFIIDSFFDNDDKTVRYNFILFLFVPLLFVVLTTVINLSTGKVYDILVRDGIFFDELFILSRVFMIISFSSIGVLIACVYWLHLKLKDRKSFMEGMNGN